jgi:hypothetical protein
MLRIARWIGAMVVGSGGLSGISDVIEKCVNTMVKPGPFVLS